MEINFDEAIMVDKNHTLKNFNFSFKLNAIIRFGIPCCCLVVRSSRRAIVNDLLVSL